MYQARVDKPKALSLFSGAGGIDIGIRNAGFSVLACVERDPFCCETLRTNISRESLDTKIIEDDIRNIHPATLMSDLNLKLGELDLLVGGPPCQAFSQIGKRLSIQDERGMLLFEMPRFAKVFRPKVILTEQVKGLLNAQDHNKVIGGVFTMIIRELEDIGYKTKWRLLLAADYGVPQMRQRVFIVATLGEVNFDFPDPTYSSVNNAKPLFDLPIHRTVGEVI